MTQPTPKHKEEAREVLASVWKSYVDNEKLVNTVASALSSRDTQIREVLEGLRGQFGAKNCWCDAVEDDTPHLPSCEATKELYDQVQPVKEGNNGD